MTGINTLYNRLLLPRLVNWITIATTERKDGGVRILHKMNFVAQMVSVNFACGSRNKSCSFATNTDYWTRPPSSKFPSLQSNLVCLFIIMIAIFQFDFPLASADKNVILIVTLSSAVTAQYLKILPWGPLSGDGFCLRIDVLRLNGSCKKYM